MRVLVTYATHFGSTRGIAERIADTIRAGGGDVDCRPADAGLDKAETYDAFVVGSAVHGGRWLKPATQFVRENVDALSRAPVWLFSSGPIGESPRPPAAT